MTSKQRSTMEQNIMMLQKNRSKIKELILKGIPIDEISIMFNTTPKTIQRNIKLITSNHFGTLDLGQKEGPYYETEDEMYDFKEYNYNNLSDGEREIYLERKKTGELGKYFASPYGFHGGH